MVLTLIFMKMSFADTIHEKNVKKEMLERVDTLLSKIEECRDDLKSDDVVKACGKIDEIFAIYPEHLKALGVHMDLFASKTVKSTHSALSQLIFVHQQSLVCKQGQNSEYVDPEALRKELKRIERSLKKQRKYIKRKDVGNNNSYYYNYEFEYDLD